MMNRNMMRQAQELQNKLLKVQEELANAVIEATAGGGMVKVTINGQQEFKSITIDKEVVNPDDVEMLQDLVLAAVKEAIVKSQELAQKRMGAITGGLKIPGLM